MPPSVLHSVSDPWTSDGKGSMVFYLHVLAVAVLAFAPYSPTYRTTVGNFLGWECVYMYVEETLLDFVYKLTCTL